jgi:hypothetical protein
MEDGGVTEDVPHTMANEALCRLIEAAVSQLCVYINDGSLSMSAKDHDIRISLFRIIHTLPIVCKAFVDEAASHEALPYILFYERLRVSGVTKRPPKFFLEGLPVGVSIASGDTVKTLSQSDVTGLNTKKMMENRSNLVGKLEMSEGGSAFKVETCRQHRLPDVPASVPGPVQVVVSICRSVMQAMRMHRPAKNFHNCSNQLCGRLIYRGHSIDLASTGLASSSSSDNSKECNVLGISNSTTNSYWSRACGNPVAVERPQSRFCCEACFNQHENHLKEMLPDGLVELNYDDFIRAVPGRSRVRLAFQAALKRNERAARAIRTASKRPRNYLAVSHSEIEKHRARRICAFNVDLGILYAASVVAESSTISRNLALPGYEAEWRTDQAFYSKAIDAVLKIYSRNKNGSIVSNMLTSPKFMENIRSKAASLF